MTREEFDIGLELLKGEGVTLDLLSGLTKLVDEYIKTLEATIEAQEIIIKDMAQPKIEFIDTSCMRCKNVNDCSLCENVKNETGMKLREMSFVCFEPKVQL